MFWYLYSLLIKLFNPNENWNNTIGGNDNYLLEENNRSMSLSKVVHKAFTVFSSLIRFPFVLLLQIIRPTHFNVNRQLYFLHKHSRFFICTLFFSFEHPTFFLNNYFPFQLFFFFTLFHTSSLYLF